jgi:hypothetical protein
MCGFELPGGFHIGEELVADHLNALGVQGELPALGSSLQRVSIGPGLMPEPGLLMELATHVPHAGGFHLGRPQALSRGKGEPVESIDAYGLHIRSWHGIVFGSITRTSVLVKRGAVRGCVSFFCRKEGDGKIEGKTRSKTSV